MIDSIFRDVARPGRAPAVGRSDALAAGLFVVVAAFAAPPPAQATIVYAQSSVCGGSPYDPVCYSGPSAIWTPPNGALVSTSVQRAWSDPMSPDDSFSLIGAAQSSVSNVNHWTAYVSAGGYAHTSYYGANGVSAIASALIEDEYFLPSTATWSGAGFLSFTYHLSGDASVAYQYIGTDARDNSPSAAATISFLCYNTGYGNCLGEGLNNPSPGVFNDALTGVFDRDVTFMIPVTSDTEGFYQFRDTLSAGIAITGNADPGFVTGGATADFTHTVQLVAADLLDSSMVPVPGWSIESGSGFDYAHIAAVVIPPPTEGTVPEPSTLALLGFGLFGATLATRRTRARGRAAHDGASCP